MCWFFSFSRFLEWILQPFFWNGGGLPEAEPEDSDSEGCACAGEVDVNATSADTKGTCPSSMLAHASNHELRCKRDTKASALLGSPGSGGHTRFQIKWRRDKERALHGKEAPPCRHCFREAHRRYYAAMKRKLRREADKPISGAGLQGELTLDDHIVENEPPKSTDSDNGRAPLRTSHDGLFDTSYSTEGPHTVAIAEPSKSSIGFAIRSLFERLVVSRTFTATPVALDNEMRDEDSSQGYSHQADSQTEKSGHCCSRTATWHRRCAATSPPCGRGEDCIVKRGPAGVKRSTGPRSCHMQGSPKLRANARGQARAMGPPASSGACASPPASSLEDERRFPSHRFATYHRGRWMEAGHSGQNTTPAPGGAVSSRGAFHC